MTFPDFLTFARLFLAFPLFYFIAACKNSPEAQAPALIIFFIAAITDLFDGFLARKRNSASRLGEFLDPLADKVLLISGFTALLLAQNAFKIPLMWVLVSFYAREIMILGGSAVLFFISKKFQKGSLQTTPDRLGKYTTAAQMILLLIVLLNMNKLVAPVAVITGFLTIASGILYIRRGLNFIFKKESCRD